MQVSRWCTVPIPREPVTFYQLPLPVASSGRLNRNCHQRELAGDVGGSGTAGVAADVQQIGGLSLYEWLTRFKTIFPWL